MNKSDHRINTNYKILLDMDGVIVDLVNALMKMYNIKVWPKGIYHISKILGVEKELIWTKTNVMFWENLKPTKEFKEIMEILNSFGFNKNICLLTSNLWFNNLPRIGIDCIIGKIRWIKKHLPNYLLNDAYLIGPAKEFCASSNHILIDDKDTNIDKFIKSGGQGILWPRPWNKNHEIYDDGMSLVYLKKELSNVITNR